MSTGAEGGEPATSARDYAATHPIVCAHADEDGQGAHILAPGEKCDRRSEDGPVMSKTASEPIPPLETEQQALDLPAVRAVYEAFGKDPGLGKMTPHNMRMLSAAMAAAGVPVGAYDVRIAEWLAGQEPQVVATIAGWITRAAEGKS